MEDFLIFCVSAYGYELAITFFFSLSLLHTVAKW